MKDLIVRRLLRVKWGLAVMAVFSLFLSFYVYVTPAQGGTGMFMITPTNGLEGTIEQLPWFLIVFGALAFIGSVVSKSTWVLGFVEPVMALIMFVVGFWELFFPYDFTVVSQTWAVVGVFLSFYVMFHRPRDRPQARGRVAGGAGARRGDLHRLVREPLQLRR